MMSVNIYLRCKFANGKRFEFLRFLLIATDLMHIEGALSIVVKISAVLNNIVFIVVFLCAKPTCKFLLLLFLIHVPLAIQKTGTIV